jgi:hypothetical protein
MKTSLKKVQTSALNAILRGLTLRSHTANKKQTKIFVLVLSQIASTQICFNIVLLQLTRITSYAMNYMNHMFSFHLLKGSSQIDLHNVTLLNLDKFFFGSTSSAVMKCDMHVVTDPVMCSDFSIDLLSKYFLL